MEAATEPPLTSPCSREGKWFWRLDRRHTIERSGYVTGTPDPFLVQPIRIQYWSRWYSCVLSNIRVPRVMLGGVCRGSRWPCMTLCLQCVLWFWWDHPWRAWMYVSRHLYIGQRKTLIDELFGPKSWLFFFFRLQTWCRKLCLTS